MDELAATLVSCLARTTGWLSLAAIMAFLLLHSLRCKSPAAHRAAWALVLLAGWGFVRGTVTIPWYERPSVVRSVLRSPRNEIIEEAQSAPLPDAAPDLSVIRQDAESVGAQSPRHVAANAVPWPVLLVGGWLLGVLAVVGCWLSGYVRFVRALPFGLPLTEEWETEWRDVLAECAVRRSVRLCVAHGTEPLVCRVVRGYRLFVPVRLWRELPSPDRRAILRHELAHVRRGDLVTSLLARCLVVPHWFNPFAWWAVRNFEECGEWACDDAVRGRDPGTAPAYARVLLRLGQDDRQPRFGAAIGGRRLSTRIKRILTGAIPEDSTMKKSVLLGSIGLLTLLAAVEWRLGPRGAAAEQEVDATRPEHKVDRALLTRMVDDAANTYQATMTAYMVGEAIMADVYVWSRRWLDAERAIANTEADEIAALRDHRERMKRLFLQVNALYTDGVRGGERPKFFATKYYLHEADVWLAAAKNRDTGKPAQAKSVAVSFDGPVGMTVTWDDKGQGAFDSERLIVPGVHEFVEGEIYRLQMADFQDAAGIRLFGTLELVAARDNKLTVDVRLADVKEIVLDNAALTKVFYVGKDAQAGTVGGEWSRPDEELVAAAEGLGEVVAILRLGRGM
ncbi:MAG TPA: M56 family metallopeptidase [Pirellulales bacterium]|nr:M56 family metallopeptidase [Pirellulales bacterium]